MAYALQAMTKQYGGGPSARSAGGSGGRGGRATGRQMPSQSLRLCGTAMPLRAEDAQEQARIYQETQSDNEQGAEWGNNFARGESSSRSSTVGFEITSVCGVAY